MEYRKLFADEVNIPVATAVPIDAALVGSSLKGQAKKGGSDQDFEQEAVAPQPGEKFEVQPTNEFAVFFQE